jgi:hypothetical protein
MTPTQVPFGGEMQCTDRTNGDLCRIRVWGAFVGTGVDPHEVKPIQDWIGQALVQLLNNFQGSLQELPRLGHRWGEAVDMQLGPALFQQFEARGQVQIHGVEVRVERPGPRPPPGAPPGYVPGSIPTSVSFSGSAAFAAKLAQQLMAGAGLTPQQAQQAVSITLALLQSEGVTLPPHR